jgi:hypothetical protein
MSTIDPDDPSASSPYTVCENGHPLTADMSFCQECGSPRPVIDLVCANGHPMAEGSSFCQICGVPRQYVAGYAGPRPLYVQPVGTPRYTPPDVPYQYAPSMGISTSVPQSYNGLAIASMVLGIVWIYWVGSVLALVFGYIALKQIRARNESGKGMAIAGIVLGWVGAGVLLIVIVVAIVASSSNHFNGGVLSPSW